MTKRLIAGAFFALTLISGYAAKNDTDPVLMTVNGHDVRMSEFEYLFHKNNAQQANPQSVNEYLDLFITYKLKVADARAEGIDTTATFVNEFKKYRAELAEPYMRDDAATEELIQEAYRHMKENVDIDHLMLPLGETNAEYDRNKSLADSLRNAIVNGANFYELADKHSIDPAKARNHGHTGWISAGVYPYEFEKQAYDTPVGEITPVFETGFGFHILKINGRKPHPGEVLVQHILLLFDRNRTAEKDAIVKERIDSIYNVLIAGGDFAELAAKYSADGSAKREGKLPWFGPGRMVPEFEKVSFELADGAISKPFATQYGYHIVRKIDHRAIQSLDELRPTIQQAMENDGRIYIPKKKKYEQLQTLYNSHINKEAISEIVAVVEKHNCLDSAAIAEVRQLTTPLLIVADSTVTTSQFFSTLTRLPKIQATQMEAFIGNYAKGALEAMTFDYESNRLEQRNSEFRNLVNEYLDGMLLFEVSNRKVWERASLDKEGLEKFFVAHKDKYTWDSPHYKGYMLYTTSDSLLNEIREYVESTQIPTDSIGMNLRSRFGKDIKIERLIVAKGDNAIVDEMVFDGPKPDLPDRRWPKYMPYNYRLINAPEEAIDVRGQVTGDYQEQLMEEWVKQLHKRYKVKVNRKLLKKVK